MSKPTFDPAQPFESVKPAFDPSQPFTVADQEPFLNRAADAITGVMQKIDNPMGRDMGNAVPLGMSGGDDLFNKAGSAVAGYLGEKMPNHPYLAAGAGTLVSMANPQNWLSPRGQVNGTLLKPAIPAERQAAVDAARAANVPLSRAEQTGGKFITGAENLLEKTPLGSIPMDESRRISDTAMQGYKERLQGEMGTPKQKYDVGSLSLQSQSTRDAAMNQTRQKMFDAVPDNVRIPLNESVGTADTIIQEQSKYLPTTRNGDVLSIAQDVQNAHGGVSGGEPNYQLLKRLRETLGGKAQEARKAKNFTAERDYLRLKSAVDKDVDTFVSGQKTPLGSMMGKEFADRYEQANAFSGAYKQLFKGDLATTIANAPPEKILDSVFQKNNETAIKQFRAIVGDEAFQQAKRKWVDDLLESPNVSQALSEKKIDPGTLSAILTPTEQTELSKFGSVQGIRKTVGNLQGTNGSARMTAQTLSYGAGLDALYRLIQGDVKGAAVMGSAFAGPYPIAKALTSKAATEGIDVSLPLSARNAALSNFYSNATKKKGDSDGRR